ncbi:hypothetical protein [Acidimangrovimonas pyrenivorans]|uniref:Uncharacterized protein n=1 Tax=Acidimangrovimonas pyrenivorans TaxID=2030798 RepID=A0ABV7AJ40_9RHOB
MTQDRPTGLRRASRPLAALVSAALLLAAPPATARPLFPEPPRPFAADPAAITVSVLLPDGIGLIPGSAALVLTASGGPGAAARQARDRLEQAGAPEPVQGGMRFRLRLATPQAAELTQLQATVRGWRARGLQPQSAIEVTFIPCRARAEATGAPFALSVRFAPSVPALALTAPGATLQSALGRAPAELPACP